MELTVEMLRNAVFSPAWRGYDMSNVDEFVNDVAVGVQELQEKVHALTLRAERAESKLGGENDETVKRTLVLAQKAADLVVTEAKAIAERVVADAHRDAARIVEDAQQAASERAKQADSDFARSLAERAADADAQHALVLQGHARTVAEAQAGASLAQSRTSELHSQTLIVRDRVRALLADHLARIDRLADATGQYTDAGTATESSPE